MTVRSPARPRPAVKNPTTGAPSAATRNTITRAAAALTALALFAAAGLYIDARRDAPQPQSAASPGIGTTLGPAAHFNTHAAPSGDSAPQALAAASAPHQPIRFYRPDTQAEFHTILDRLERRIRMNLASVPVQSVLLGGSRGIAEIASCARRAVADVLGPDQVMITTSTVELLETDLLRHLLADSAIGADAVLADLVIGPGPTIAAGATIRSAFTSPEGWSLTMSSADEAVAEPAQPLRTARTARTAHTPRTARTPRPPRTPRPGGLADEVHIRIPLRPTRVDGDLTAVVRLEFDQSAAKWTAVEVTLEGLSAAAMTGSMSIS